MGRILFDVLELNIVVSIIILVLCPLTEKLRKRYGARWLKLVWILLAFRLLIPYNFSLPFTEIRLFNTPDFAQEVPEDAGSISVTNSEVIQGTAGKIGSNTGNEATSESKQEVLEQVEESVGTNVVLKQGKGTNILLTIWLIGAAFLSIYYISIYTSFQHKCRKSMVLLKDGELLAQVNDLQVDCLGKVYINVYQSELTSTPMLIGFLVPRLVLPTNVKEWQQEELRMVVLHELCHYQQKDLWLKWIVLACHCLNWFNPALILMKRQCFYDIELVCDMTVLEECSLEERELYARTMLKFAKGEKQTVAFSTNFSASKKDLKNRINSMFDVSEKKSGLAAFLWVGVLLVGMSLLISCGYKPEELDDTNAQEQLVEIEENSGKVDEQNIDESDKQELQTEDIGVTVAPTKDEVLAMREKVLEGMTDEAIIPDTGATGTGVLGMQKITQEEAAVSPAIIEYALDEALEAGEVLKFEGNLPGTGIGTLYIIDIDGVEHFYGQYDFYGYDRKDYYGYAILSENYELGCGIKVGMSQGEVLAKYPDMRIEDFEGNCLSDSEYPNAVWWNGTAYPDNWLDQFDYVMIADIDLGTNDTLPVCLGLLMKDEKVKSITFYYPTAG